MPAPATSIDDLRRELRERFPGAHQERPPAESYRLPGLPPLPKATIAELVASPAVSGSSLLISFLLEEDDNDLPLALIDPADSFDPASYHLRRPLLWLRSDNPKRSLKAADLLLRDGNLPLVLIDLTLTPLRELQKLPSSSWYRLRTLAETSGTSLLALTPAPLIAAAPARHQLQNTLTLEHLHQVRTQLMPQLETQPLHQEGTLLNQQS
ncbi:MAG: hypothetical protein AAF191_20500 [Verrucomicrobiota bacterium]